MKAPLRSSFRLKAKLSWGSLPLELQMQVLSWLPVEDILRLDLVCKQWASLLRDPQFKALWSRAQNSRHRPRTFFLLQQGTHRLRKRTRYYKYPSSGPYRLQDLPWEMSTWLIPEGTKLFMSAGGLVVYISKKTCFLVGNPLTQQWVNVPPLQSEVERRRTFMLMPYMSEGSMFFRITIDSYLFDSKVGIWTLPAYQTIWTFSVNKLHIQGVLYGLGLCKRHHAVVLLEIDNLGALSESKWLWAWELCELRVASRPFMLEVGGEIGLLVQMLDREIVVLVLDRKSGKEWRWSKVSTLPKHIRKEEDFCFASKKCCTHGNLTFMFIGSETQVVVFDSQRMTWELVGKRLLLTEGLIVWVPDFTVVPNVNTPSEELKRSCASRYREAGFINRNFGTFSELKALSKRGMSWQQIGEVLADRKKGGILMENCIA